MTEPVGWTFLTSKRWLGYWALLLIFSVVCVLLGNWQFARRADARAEIARIDANYDAEPVALQEALTTPSAFDEDAQKWLPVTVAGVYLEQEQLVVRNRPNASEVGYEILAPLELDSGEVFIVNRGWIPASSDGSVAQVELPALPEGPVQVTARLKASEPTITGRVPELNSIGTINLDQVQSLIGVPTYTGAYGLLINEEPSADHGALAERPERDEGPHLSYALQWYVFIVIALLGTLYGARQEYRSLNPDSPRTRAQDERRSRRRARNGRSDAEDEDALLDAQ